MNSRVVRGQTNDVGTDNVNLMHPECIRIMYSK